MISLTKKTVLLLLVLFIISVSLSLLCTSFTINGKSFIAERVIFPIPERPELPPVLPRRPHKFSLKTSELVMKEAPSWQYCPPATSPTGIFVLVVDVNYARGAVVMSRAISHLWNTSRWGPEPDFRVMLPYPNTDKETLKMLEAAGMQVCLVPRVDSNGKGNIRLKECFAKFHAWNMTAYEKILVVDSDLLIRRDIGELLRYADQLRDPKSTNKGARIAGGITCCQGNSKINFGTVVIKPDYEEYLWLYNLMLLEKVKLSSIGPADENFLNIVYSAERLYFPRGLSEHHHWLEADPSLWNSFATSLNVYHFSGCTKPWAPSCKEPYNKYCQIWKEQESKFVENSVPDFFDEKCRE